MMELQFPLIMMVTLMSSKGEVLQNFDVMLVWFRDSRPEEKSELAVA